MICCKIGITEEKNRCLYRGRIVAWNFLFKQTSESLIRTWKASAAHFITKRSWICSSVFSSESLIKGEALFVPDIKHSKKIIMMSLIFSWPRRSKPFPIHESPQMALIWSILSFAMPKHISVRTISFPLLLPLSVLENDIFVLNITSRASYQYSHTSYEKSSWN